MLVIVAEPAVPFTLEYRAYIPFDHVTGSPAAQCALPPYAQTTAVYLGDSPDSVSPLGTPLTYRASIFSVVTPNSAAPVTFVTPDTGTTFQFAPPSPDPRPFITAPDYTPQGTCNRLSGTKQAKFGSNANGTYAVNNSSTTNSVTVQESGTIANPLATQALSIGWNFKAVISENSGTNTVNVQVSGQVTCFPAHEVLFQGMQVAYYVPLNRNPFYIAYCLGGPATSSWTGGVAVAPGGVTLPY